MKKLFLLFLFIQFSVASYACHGVTITETNAVDNGDGTYTYTFDVCMGIEDTYGFYLSFGGTANIVSYTGSVTGPSTGNTKNASVPPVSGNGQIEYGDWDDNTTSLLSGATNDCMSVTITFDDVITSATIDGTQPDYTGGPCSGTTSDVTSCFASMATNTVTINTNNCCGGGGCKTFYVDLDGTTLATGVSDGNTYTFNYCGACASTISTEASTGGCSIGSWTVTDASGNVTGSGTGDVVNGSLNPCTLPIELIEFDAEYSEDQTELYWKTATEINNDYFTVERSKDGEQWNKIEYVEGAGNSNEELQYEIKDENPHAGLNYYRLKQTDYDGKYSYSDIIFVDHSSGLDNRKPVRITNYMGQEVTEDFKGIKFIIYENGDVEKKVDLRKN